MSEHTPRSALLLRALDSLNYRDGEAALAQWLTDPDLGALSQFWMVLDSRQKRTLAGALEVCETSGLLGDGASRRAVELFLVQAEKDLQPAAFAVGVARWQPDRTFDAARLHQRLREIKGCD
jgi:hypothetical protein